MIIDLSECSIRVFDVEGSENVPSTVLVVQSIQYYDNLVIVIDAVTMT